MSTKHTPGPVAQRQREVVCRTEWKVTLADGRIYYVDTYPDSQRVFIQAHATMRPVRGKKVEAEVRAAIAKATGSAA
jgi:hypothetical protein